MRRTVSANAVSATAVSATVAALLAAALLAVPACAAPQPFDAHRVPDSAPLEGQVVDVQATNARGLVLVPVLLEGHGPFWFVLDTGSTTVVVDLRLAEDLGIHIESKTGSILTEAGRSDGTVQEATIRELRMEGAQFQLVSALAMDMTSISHGAGRTVDGILGMTLFQNRLWSVDPVRATLRIEDGALAADEPHVMPLGMDGGLPTIRIDVAGHEMHAIVDTGQRIAVSVSPEDAAPLHPGLRVIGESVGQVLDGEVRREVARLDGDVRIGSLLTLRAPALLLGRATRVGLEAFPDRVLTFDFANRRMRATPAP